MSFRVARYDRGVPSKARRSRRKGR